MYSQLAASPIPRGTEMDIGDFCHPMSAEHGIDTGAANSRQVKSKSYATEEAWNHMRATITRLYHGEGRPLKEVKGIMERDYRLYATQRMFKTRIVRWGLDKKLKEEEVIHMLRLKQQRQAAGKDSSFRVRDQNIDWDRVKQYLKRRPDLENKRHAIQHNLDLEITCRTPSPSPSTSVKTHCIPSLLEPTLDVDIQEDIMRIFKKYHTGAFESGVWVLEGTNLCEHGFVCAVQTLSNIGKAPMLLKRNQTEAGFRTLHHGLISLRYILQTREPTFYYSMLVNVLNLQGNARESAIHFVYQMHNEVLGDQHPLTLVWKKLRVLPQELRLEALRNMYAIVSLHVESEGAYKNQHGLNVLRMRCSLLKLLKDMTGNEFQEITSSHTAAVTDSLNEGRYGLSCKILLGLAIAQLDADEVEHAEDTLARIGSIVKAKSKVSSREQWLDKQEEDRCSASSLCSRERRYDTSTSYTRMVYGYYKGHWEPWSGWSSAAVRMIVDAHRQAEAGDVGAAQSWFDILLALSSGFQPVYTEDS